MLLEGVRIDLLDADGNVIATTFTDANGEYEFTGLRPGMYHGPRASADRVLRRRRAGRHGRRRGAATWPADYSIIAGINLASGVDAIQYDFCEKIGVMLSGNVYHDRANDGIFDRAARREGIGGVVVKLLDASGNDTGLRATTDADGFYKFNNLAAGKYAVMEIQPSGWLDGIDTPGNLGGVADVSPPGDMISQIMINWGEMGIEYNFGELLPGSIRGQVVVSTDPDCDPDDGEPPIAGVQIDLLDGDGQRDRHDAHRRQRRVRVHQSAAGRVLASASISRANTSTSRPTSATAAARSVSTNLLGDIDVGSDEHLVDYDFCEEPPAELSGYVYIDGPPIVTNDALTPQEIAALRDGLRTADDTPLAGVVLELRDGADGEPITGDLALPGTYGDGTDSHHDRRQRLLSFRRPAGRARMPWSKSSRAA